MKNYKDMWEEMYDIFNKRIRDYSNAVLDYDDAYAIHLELRNKMEEIEYHHNQGDE